MNKELEDRLADYHYKLKAADKRIAELRDALRYCSGRMDNPRCPRCADVQQVAHEALDKDDEL